MTPRLRPQELSFGELTPSKRGQVPLEPSEGYGAIVKRQEFGGCEVYYRSKPTDKGEVRRYYIGHIQFGFVEVLDSGRRWIVHRSAQHDAPAGCIFSSEKEAELFLRQQLIAK